MIAIVAGESAALIVEAEAVLTAAGFGGQDHGAWVYDEVAPMKIDWLEFWMFQRFTDATVAAGGAVNAVVESPAERVEHSLYIDALDAFGKASEDSFTNISLAIAVSVFEIEDVGSCTDKDAAVVTEYGCGPGKVISEDSALLIDAIAVCVFQHADAAEMGSFIAALGVIDHFDDEEASVFIEGEGDRAGDVWFASSDFQMEAFFDLECFKSVFGFDGRESGKIVGCHCRLCCTKAESAIKEDLQK